MRTFILLFSEEEGGDPLEGMEDEDGEFVKKENGKKEEDEAKKEQSKHVFPGEDIDGIWYQI